jgi:hypothetical protein
MQNPIDVLEQKEGDLENALRELADVQIALEKAQQDFDVLRTAVQMCADNESEIVAEAVRRRAYKLYERRGYRDGFDRDDWLQAEAEILGSSLAEPKDCSKIDSI